MILRRYIFRDLFQKQVWILSLLVLIIVGNRFVSFLADAATGKLAGDLVFLMLAYNVLAALPKILPVSILIAVLLVFSRMSNERELVVFASAGVNRLFQIGVVARFATLFCVIVAIVTLYLAPWAESHLSALKQRSKQESDISNIRPAQFKEFSRGDRVVYVQESSPDNLSMKEVFLQVRQGEKLSILVSDSVRFKIDEDSGNKYIVFNNGRRYVGWPGMLDYQITKYEKYALLAEAIVKVKVTEKVAGLATMDIVASDNTLYQAEFQWRISIILSCLLLPFFGILLYQPSAKERRYLPFVIAISIYLIYSNLLGIARNLLKRGVVPEVIGLWWVHLLLICVLCMFYFWPQIRLNRRKDDKQQFISVEK